MHSNIIQIGTEPFNPETGRLLTEMNVMDYNEGKIDYAVDVDYDEQKEALESLLDLLPEGMFTLIVTPSESKDEDGGEPDPELKLRYEGGYEEWAKQYVETVQTLAAKVTPEKAVGWQSGSYRLREFIDDPLNTGFLFCDDEDLCVQSSSRLMEFVQGLKKGDFLYIYNVMNYHM